MEELLQIIRWDAGEGGRFVNEALANHFNSSAHSSGTGPFAVTSLQHIKMPVLNRELDILHIAVMRF